MSDWYKMNPVDWNEGTNSLTLEQEAAYLRICNAIYIAGGPISNNAFVVAGLLRCNDRKAKRLVSELEAAGKLTIEGASICNRRALDEVSNRRRRRTDGESAGGRREVGAENLPDKTLKNNEVADGDSRVRAESRVEKEREKNYYTSPRVGLIEQRIGELYDALGVTDETKLPALLTFSEPLRWISAGCDIDADIIPALRSIRARGKAVKTWAYCSDAVFEARDSRLAPTPAVRPRTAPPSTAPPAPRNAGERALLKLQSEYRHEPTDAAPRRLEAGNGRRQAESLGHAGEPAIPQGAIWRS